MVSYFYIYKDSSGEWRWRFVASNSKTIAISSEGYRNLTDCEHSIKLVQADARMAPITGDQDYKKLRP